MEDLDVVVGVGALRRRSVVSRVAKQPIAVVLAALSCLASLGIVHLGLRFGPKDGLGHVMASGFAIVGYLAACLMAGVASVLTRHISVRILSAASFVTATTGLALLAR